MKNMFLILAGLSMLFSSDIRAGDSPVKARLLTNTVHFTRPFTVAIYCTIQPGWYLYWKNPGDAGLPMKAIWSLPGGFSAGELEYPTPEKIVHGDIVAYGYHDDVVLRTTITPPPDYRARGDETIKADLSWLVCSESCVPGGEMVSLPLKAPEAAERENAAALLTRFAERMPKPLSDLNVGVRGSVVQTRTGGWQIRIALEGGEGADVTDFYPDAIDDAVVDFRNIHVSAGSIVIPFTPYTPSTVIREVRGLAVVQGKGYKLESSLR